ncbi:hypothetical protein [Celerinatantimonas yamalensis]|uniref:Uncharacterized protein n=1 Tax=Celerinatantimonas yamalensis TaxID=559956 RepID=A0ABW9G4Z1_9GAMM
MKFNVICAVLGTALASQVAHADQFNNLGFSYGLGGDQHQGTVEFDKTVMPNLYIGGQAGYDKDRHHSGSHADSLGVHVGGFMPFGNSGMIGYGEVGYTSVNNHGYLSTVNGNNLDLFHTELGLTGPLTPATFYKVYGVDNINMGSGNKVNYQTAFGGEVGYNYLPDLSFNVGLKHLNTNYNGNRASNADDVVYLKSQMMF